MPNLPFWNAALALLALQDRSLKHLNANTDHLAGINKELREMITMLRNFAQEEVNHQPLTNEEMNELSWIGGQGERLTLNILKTDPLPDREKHIGLVADVYAFNQDVLEEAVGAVDALYVLVEINGTPVLGHACAGAGRGLQLLRLGPVTVGFLGNYRPVADFSAPRRLPTEPTSKHPARMSLTTYRTLGRSGLIVSPLSLGTMTFGTQRWGSPDDVSEAIFNEYVDGGGNFIDTADVYAKGRSEELVGQYVATRSLREQLVLATKSGFGTQPGNPHGGGNGRKHIYQALEGSLRRLQTDYVDLYWLHVWDTVTPAEEVLQTFGDLVRAGKIRYFGLSDVPAWYATQLATLARAHGVPGPVALQLEYSLVERSIEREHVPAAQHLGLGIVPWAPLAAGFLADKYQREGENSASGEGRLTGPSPYGNQKFTDHNWRVLDVLREVAKEAELPTVQVALAWAAAQPGITAPIVGASKLAQLQSNVAALEVRLTADQLRRLDEASALPPVFPYPVFAPAVNKTIFGGHAVQGWQG